MLSRKLPDPIEGSWECFSWTADGFGPWAEAMGNFVSSKLGKAQYLVFQNV